MFLKFSTKGTSKSSDSCFSDANMLFQNKFNFLVVSLLCLRQAYLSNVQGWLDNR